MSWLKIKILATTEIQLENALNYYNISEGKIENLIEKLEENPTSQEFITEEITESFKKLEDILNNKVPLFYDSLENKEKYYEKIKTSKQNFENLKQKFAETNDMVNKSESMQRTISFNRKKRLQEEELSPHKIFNKLEEIFSKIKTKSVRESYATEKLVNDYPSIAPNNIENLNEFYMKLMKDYHSIYFEIGKKGISFKITSIYQRIIRRIEEIMIDRDDKFYQLDLMLNDDPILKNIIEKKEDIFESFKIVSSSSIFIKLQSPISIGFYSHQEIVAKQVDYFFDEKNLSKDKTLQQSMKKNHGCVKIQVILSLKQILNLLKEQKSQDEKSEYLIGCIEKYCKNATMEKNGTLIRAFNNEEKLLMKMNELFSDDYYSTNNFLKELSSQHDEGFIDLNIILGFPEIKNIIQKFPENTEKIHQILSVSEIFTIKDHWIKKNFSISKMEISEDVEFLDKINFLFGDANFSLDFDLIKKTQENSGFISIEQIMRDYDIKYENKSTDELMNILKKSKIVDCHSSNPWIKRKNKIDFRKVILSGVNANTFNFKHINEDLCFTVMQYNILADYLCNFEYATTQSKLWENRKRIISKEIKFYMPDIFCLEEVQTTKFEKRKSFSNPDDHYTWFLGEFFEDYSSIYKRKLSTKKGPEIGNAIFWKKEIFEMKEKYEIDLSKEISKDVSDEKTKKNLINYPQVALIAKLLHLPSNQEILVTVIHTSSHYQSPHIQCCQVQCCLNKIKEIEKQEGKSLPIVFCGDFNSGPKTEVYSLLSNGKLTDDEFIKLYEKSYQDSFELPFNFSHDLQLTSAYYDVNYEEPSITHATSTFDGTLDYIWFSRELLTTIAVLETPKEEEIKKEIGLPNSRYPSDHLPLLAKFQFK
eukprot:gene7709-12175_t